MKNATSRIDPVGPPSVERVAELVSQAIYARDPIDRQLAEARLRRWNLPAAPVAIELTARVLAEMAAEEKAGV